VNDIAIDGPTGSPEIVSAVASSWLCTEGEAYGMDASNITNETVRPIDVQAAQHLLDALAGVTALEERLRPTSAGPHHPHSLLATDITAEGGNPGFNSASIAITSAIDHLRTWAHLIGIDLNRFPLPILSHFTLARATYESSLTTLWLLDPGISKSERIGRGYAIQLQSLADMSVYQRSAGISGREAKASALYARLLAAARRDGYVRVTAKSKVHTSKPKLTVPVPTISELFDMYDQSPPSGNAHARARYNLMSGLAHSRHWAVAGTAADLSSASNEGFRLEINFPLVCSLAESTMAIATRAIDAFIGYRTVGSAAQRDDDRDVQSETVAECEMCSSGLPAAYSARTPAGGDIQICERCATTTAVSEKWRVVQN